MALLAEVIVEEWLNRQGYFTLRGMKIGVDEIDLLAIRPRSGALECRHRGTALGASAGTARSASANRVIG
jgi:hypothetical protein